MPVLAGRPNLEPESEPEPRTWVAVSVCLIAGPSGAPDTVEWKLTEFSKQRPTGSLETQIKCLAEDVGPSVRLLELCTSFRGGSREVAQAFESLDIRRLN